MKTPLLSRAAVFGLLTACLAAPMPKLKGAVTVTGDSHETVLFPFDDAGIPFQRGLILTLSQGRKSVVTDPKHPNKPVLSPGAPGSPDERRIYFYGTVLFIDGQYRMWYDGYDKEGRRQICYAVSADGLKWERPKLGLVEYRGGKENNLVAIDGGQPVRGMCALVVYDPEDPDPARRYKMVREIDPTQVLASVSADGLTWQSVAGNKDIILANNLEPSGFIKHNGAYYLNGHGGSVPHPLPTRGEFNPRKRKMETYVSYDFEHWSSGAHLSFRRDRIPPRPPESFEIHQGEQIHLGAGLWDRGNVILGFYGQYHNPSADRRSVVVDIGLLVSNDALHFREPLPDFKMVSSAEETDRAEQRITQAQGFQNIGDRSFIYYGIWTEINRDSPTGVRIATWPRDRFGYFSPNPGSTDSHCITQPVTPTHDGTRIFLNASGLSDLSTLTVEILDDKFRPLPEFSGANSITLQKTGFRQEVTWKGANSLGKLRQPFRVRVNWGGRDPESARLHAIYVE